MNSLSVAAVEAMITWFCEDFDLSTGIHSPGDASTTDLHFMSTKEIYVPISDFELVLPWLMLHRDELALGYPVDILIYPDIPTDCASAMSSWIGQQPAIDLNRLDNAVKAIDTESAMRELETLRKAYADNYSWAYTSYFDQVHMEPYHLDTDCSSYSSIDGYHLHAFFVSSDPESLTANTSFYDALTDVLDLPADVCADSSVEDIQDHLCWLTGPEGVFSTWPESHVGGSFTTDYISIFMPPENLTWTLSNLLYYRNAFALGGNYSMDFIVHPESGCSYADHIAWDLHAGFPWILNGYGNAKTAEWDSTDAPTIDHKAPGYLDAEVECLETPHSLSLYILYDALDTEQVDAKDECIASSAALDSLSFVFDDSAASKNASNPFLGGATQFSMESSDLGSVLSWASAPENLWYGLVDLLIVPDGGCPLHDYIAHSLWLGDKWPLDLSALSYTFVPPLAPQTPTRESKDVLDAAVPSSKRNLMLNSGTPGSVAHKKKGGDVDSVFGWVLYAVAMPNNQYSLDAFEAFLSAFSAAFQVEREGCTDMDLIAPTGNGDAMCMLGEHLDAYEDASNPISPGGAGVWIPPTDLAEVMLWALKTKSADENGIYELDLMLVPCTGTDSLEDFTTGAWQAGDAWRVKEAVLSAN